VSRLKLVSLVVPSAQAFFAADTGNEAMLYYFFKGGPLPGETAPGGDFNDCVYTQSVPSGNFFQCTIPDATSPSSYWIVESCNLFTDPACPPIYFLDSYGQNREVLRIFQTQPSF